MAPSRGKFISVLIFEWTHARIRRSFFQFRFVFMTLLLCLTYFSIEIQFWKYIQPVVESTYYICYYFNSVHNGEEMFDLDISDEFKSIVSISCKIKIFSLDIKHKIRKGFLRLFESCKLLTVYIIDKYKYEQVLHEIHKDFAHSVSIVQMC